MNLNLVKNKNGRNIGRAFEFQFELTVKYVFNIYCRSRFCSFIVSLKRFISCGETLIEGLPAGNQQDNYRVGATWSVPVQKRHAIKLQFHVGAFTNTGYDYNIVSLGYQYLFF